MVKFSGGGGLCPSCKIHGGILSTYTKMSRGGFVRGGLCPYPELMYFNFAFNLYMTLSSAENPFKQFEPRSSLTFCPDLIGVQNV